MPGFPEWEVLFWKVKVLIALGSEFCGCFRDGSTRARTIPYAGNNPAQQTASKCWEAHKTLRPCKSSCGAIAEVTPCVRSRGNIGSYRFWVLLLLCLRQKVRTDPKKVLFLLVMGITKHCLSFNRKCAALLSQKNSKTPSLA